MKKTVLNSRTLAALIIMSLAGAAVPMHAADYFPFDIWGEMTSWQQSDPAAYGRITEHGRQPMPMNELEMVQTSFPFDVWEEFQDPGSIDANRTNAFDVGYGRSEENQPVPYWLPEELKVP